jgi:hypothetical protein
MFRDVTSPTDYGAGLGPIFFVAQRIFMPSMEITGVDK